MARAPKAPLMPAADVRAPAIPPGSAQPAGANSAGAPPAPDVPDVPDAPARSLYPVLSPLKHDGKKFRPDADDPAARSVRLTEGEAEVLQAIGVLGEAIGPAVPE